MKKVNGLKLNNKGSGIVTVIVSVAFLSILATLCLLISYTNIEMKASERDGKQVMYDASTAMDEIRAGFQDVVSDALNETYSDTLKYYSVSTTAFKDKFVDSFSDQVKHWTNIPDKANSGKLSTDEILITEYGGKHYYNTKVLENMIKGCRNGEAKVVTPSSSSQEELDPSKWENIVEITDEKITFRNVCVEYKDGTRTTKVTTDIAMAYPDVSYSLSQFSMYGVPSFSVIAGGGIYQGNGSDSLISGNAYAKVINLTGTSRFRFDGSYLICRDSLNSSGNFGSLDGEEKSRFITTSNTKFWTRNININTNSVITLQGNTYVANDLDLHGNGAEANIGGTYFGFGCSDTDSSQSSSILVNATGTKLNVTDLKSLTLHGISFVNEQKELTDSEGNLITDTSSDVRMGESISVKDNQRIYLIPENHIKFNDDYAPASNPDVLTAEQIEEHGSPRLDNTVTLWKIKNREKKYSDYGADIQIIRNNTSAQVIMYYFIKFDNQIHANEFFRDYLTAHPERIDNYINKYVDVTGEISIASTRGNIFIPKKNNMTELEDADFMSAIHAESASLQASTFTSYFNNLCTHLDTADVATTANDPFEFFIKTDIIKNPTDSTGNANPYYVAQNSKKYFYDKNDKSQSTPIAVVVNGNYPNGEDVPSTVRIIIATGNVSLNSDYTGLVICGGNLNVASKMEMVPNSTTVTDVYYNAVDSKYYALSNYLNGSIGNSEMSSSDVEGKSNPVASFVTYENWKKEVE